MNGGQSQMVRVFASLDAAPLADRNIGFDEAMDADCTDPVAAAHFARSRAFGEMLLGSLERTDAMLSPCACGMATVFCACTDCLARYGEDIFGEDGK